MTVTPGPANPSADAVWDSSRLGNPHLQSDKADRVQKMFSAIAGSYDINNRVHSLWRDQAWRRYAVKAAGVRPGDTVLDVACGTGDLTEAFAATEASRVIGVDFTAAMLDVARAKIKSRPAPLAARTEYRQGNAMNLAIDTGSVDVVSIAFGIRNVSDPALAIREFYRVLKPGGRVIVLEFDRPRTPPMSWGYDFYCGWLMPRTATLIAGDRSGAYKYLPASVGSFMSRDQMKQTLADSGFKDVTATPLTFGICVCYRAVRP